MKILITLDLKADTKMNKQFSGSVVVKVKIGMEARIKPEEIEGKIHAGKTFIISGEPRDLCGTEVVALDNPDKSRFSAGYELAMLEITDLKQNAV
jgi:hypothetical protein